MRIAISITAESMDEALRDMDKAEEVADIIELRIDYMSDPNLERLLRHSQTPKIVTNRTRYEGGRFQGFEEQRIAYLEQAIALGVEYVDIELDYYHPLERANTKLIISHHNFDETPRNLDDIYQHIAKKNPDIVKIATKANYVNDSLRMLNLIYGADREIIGICMGQAGMITRVYGPAVGGYLTFASLGEGKSSASGQINVDELRRTWQLLQLE
jgi:3-dehydroquinate dehydratase / shikimate dehydrogenase